jgi:hypothetical protein
MPELNFLPDWYRVHRRRRMALAIQTAALLTMLMSMAFWVQWSHHQAKAFGAELLTLEQRQLETNHQLQLLGDQRVQQRRLERQVQALDQLGPGLSAGRFINALEAAAPPTMSLTNLSIGDTDPANGAATARGIS